MNSQERIQILIDKINTMNLDVKEYQKMGIEKLGSEIKEIIKFQDESIQSIEGMEVNETPTDITRYAKIVCKNSTEREILKIQEIYLKKIENEYLKPKKK